MSNRFSTEESATKISRTGCSARATAPALLLMFLLLACVLGVVAQPALAQTNFKLLHTFTGPAGDGTLSYGTLTRDAAGNLYGTTYGGGKANLGTVFRLSAQGVEGVLHNFTGVPDGADPQAGLLRAGSFFYGTTEDGGLYGAGSVFKVNSAGAETVLYNFTGGADGGYPYSSLISDAAGNLYGITQYGGTHNFGTVFRLDFAGVETVLHSFAGGKDGSFPYGGLVRDPAGNLYGTTQNGGVSKNGIVFKVSPAGTETVVHQFSGKTDGAFPISTLLRDSAGNLFGATLLGGASGYGTVFKISPAAKETVLYSFTGGLDGRYPGAGALAYAAGTFYGVTTNGGASALGVVYKLDLTGKETVLYNFTGGADGGQPAGSVVRDSAGNLYGTTSDYGGDCRCGTIFELTQ